MSTLLSTQPSREKTTNSHLYGYSQANKSQQCREAEEFIACQTKLHMSSPHICSTSGSFYSLLRITSLCSLQLLSFERKLQPCAAKSAELQNAWFQAPCSASQSKCFPRILCYWGLFTIAMAVKSGSYTTFSDEWYLSGKQEKSWTITLLRKVSYPRYFPLSGFSRWKILHLYLDIGCSLIIYSLLHFVINCDISCINYCLLTNKTMILL